jgi:hypothetical protein
MLYHTYLPWASALALLVTSGTARAVEPTPVPVTDAPPDKASTGDPATGGGGIQLADSSVGGKTDTGPKADNTRSNHKSPMYAVDQALPADRAPAGGRHLRRRVAAQQPSTSCTTPTRRGSRTRRWPPTSALRLGYYPLSFLGLEIEGG